MGEAVKNRIGSSEQSRLNLYTFSLASVDASHTGSEETLSGLPYKGIIKQIDIACDSEDFDLAIFDKTGAVADTINEIFRTTGENKRCSITNLNIAYRNDDTTIASALYAVMKNDDAVNASGTGTLKLYVEIPEWRE